MQCFHIGMCLKTMKCNLILNILSLYTECTHTYHTAVHELGAAPVANNVNR